MPIEFAVHSSTAAHPEQFSDTIVSSVQQPEISTGLGVDSVPSYTNRDPQQSSMSNIRGVRGLKPLFVLMDLNALVAASGIVFNRELLNKTSNGAECFHGAKSSTLLAMTDRTGPDFGCLLPFGVLRERDTIPFHGELGNCLAEHALNAHHLSVVPEASFVLAYDHASRNLEKRWIPRAQTESHPFESQAHSSIPSTSEGSSSQSLSSHNKATLDLLQKEREIQQLQQQRWPKLSDESKELVSNAFTVVFGAKLPPDDCITHVSSDELGVRNGLHPKQICSIYVPDNKVVFVKELVERDQRTGHIVVNAFSTILKASAKSTIPADSE